MNYCTTNEHIRLWPYRVKNADTDTDNTIAASRVWVYTLIRFSQFMYHSNWEKPLVGDIVPKHLWTPLKGRLHVRWALINAGILAAKMERTSLFQQLKDDSYGGTTYTLENRLLTFRICTIFISWYRNVYAAQKPPNFTRTLFKKICEKLSFKG